MSFLGTLLCPPVTTGLLTLAEAQGRLHAAADVAAADRIEVGRSREGRALELVRFGNGPRRSFWYGGPHANEPVGVTTVVELAERLVANSHVLLGEVGFDLLLCIDPDSHVRNEKWFRPSIDMAAYYRDFFRPAMSEFPDWDFPVSYRSDAGVLDRQPTMPETLAFMAALDISRPFALNALHNAELGGLHFYVSGGGVELAEGLSALADQFDVAREEATLDDPSAEPLAPGVFELPSPSSTYETVLASGVSDPVCLLPHGESAASWCAQFGTVAMVPEIPYWSLAQPLPTEGRTMGDLVRAAAVDLRAFHARLSVLVETYDRHLSDDDPYVRSVKDVLGMLGRLAAGLELWANTDGADVDATSDAVARYEVMLGLCLPQRYLGMLLTAVVQADAPSEVVSEAQSAFDDGMAKLTSLPVKVLPIQTLVDIQLAAGILTTESAAEALPLASNPGVRHS